MSALTWNEALALKQPRMDQTHREFVDLLCELEAALDAGPAALLPLMNAMVAHTDAHFAQEERWMAAIGFEPENCHSYQHSHVLQVLREVRRRLQEEDDVATVRLLVPELAQWFPLHAQSMDAGLAMTMLEVGYDPETGQLAHPPHAASASGGGCSCGGGGSSRCG